MGMGSVKEELRTTIETLSEADAARAMEFIRRVLGRVRGKDALDLLAQNRDIAVPTTTNGGFAPVEPIRGEGIPASRLLIEDRR
jgi:hypothetical protein